MRVTEWCEAIGLTKRQADNEGTEPPSAQHRLNLDLNPILRMLCKSYKKIKPSLAKRRLTLSKITSAT